MKHETIENLVISLSLALICSAILYIVEKELSSSIVLFILAFGGSFLAFSIANKPKQSKRGVRHEATSSKNTKDLFREMPKND